MKILAWILVVAALAANLAPAVLYLQGGMNLDRAKAWMLAATVFWFAAAYLKEKWDARVSQK